MYINRNLKIAVIDDDAQMREMMKDFLNQKFPNAEISVYNTGENALNGIIEAPDVIILDYNLDSIVATAMNGIQVLQKLREKFNSPVIFLSGQERADVAANTMKYGAYDYIVKSETAFSRMEIVISNIVGQSDLKKNLGTQKFFNTILVILMIVMITGFVLMRMF